MTRLPRNARTLSELVVEPTDPESEHYGSRLLFREWIAGTGAPRFYATADAIPLDASTLVSGARRVWCAGTSNRGKVQALMAGLRVDSRAKVIA